MSVTLSTTDLAELQEALATLLSPLRYESLAEWQTAACTVTRRLLRADKAMSLMPLEAEPAVAGDPLDAKAVAEWVSYYHTLDTGFLVRRRQLGLEVYHRDDLYDRSSLPRNELYNDWVVPHRLFDTLGIGITVEGSEFPAFIHFYHERESGRRFGDKSKAVLRLLLPALKASTRVFQQLVHLRSEIVRLVDRLPEGVLIADASGSALHESPALTRALGVDPEAGRIRAELLRAAQSVGAIASPRRSTTIATGVETSVGREIRTARCQYRICGTWLAPGTISREAAVLVTLEQIRPHPLSDDLLRERYRLTPREIQVARLAVRGHGAADVAHDLGISTHTARHHLEQVRTKLGRHRIGEVASALHADDRDLAVP